MKPAAVLAQRLPHADRLAGVVLVEQLHALGPALREAVAEGAGRDDVAPEVDLLEQAGVALEGAVGIDGLEV